MSTKAREWDADTYDRVSAPQFTWANEQLERLPLNGDEVVLDAGCGSGRVTALLAERLPRGRVYAVDASQAMVDHAAAAVGDRATVLCQDLVELRLPEPVDAIFSNATFHWIPDHDALFSALYRSLKPGGRLVAQCGGRGNIARFRRTAEAVMNEAPFDRYTFENAWNYAEAGETAERLTHAGFSDVQTWLQPKPTPLGDPKPFVTTVCLLPYLERLPDVLREPFVDRVLEHCGHPLVLDYVRLNMTALRPS